MRQFIHVMLLWFFATVATATAGTTNYFCIVCGKGPLTGRIWMTQWGPICNDCYQLPNHCSLCGLPIRPGDGAVKTGDGRFICRFCKTNAVLTEPQAKAVFAKARRGLIEIFGKGFALKFQDVNIKLFDVDYWSERGRSDGLHKFGFASTRKTPDGDCTHEVVMLSGRLKTELEATAAHEYTHLWINENRPADHIINRNVVEAICELTAYRLMEAGGHTNQMQKILTNPYTHGEIKQLLALDQERGTGWIFNWVKHGTTTNPDAAALAVPAVRPAIMAKHVPRPLPTTLRLDGLLLAGPESRAIICGQSFAAGDVKRVKLRDRTVLVRCLDIDSQGAKVQWEGQANPVVLKLDRQN